MSKRLVPLINAFGFTDGLIFFLRCIFKKDGLVVDYLLLELGIKFQSDAGANIL
jgi:hypothetical protein